MKLFSLNGDPIRFNLIDIERDECLVLADLIKAAGGDVTDDEESTVKFTSKEAFGKVKYPRAKIYNVDFVLACIQQGKIVDAEPFRLSPKIPGDEYHMEHFLYGRCACTSIHGSRCENVERIVAPEGLQSPTRTGNDSQESVATNETMFTARNEPSSPNIQESVDESQMVVTAADLQICAPTLAGGDAAKARTEIHEKRPCNVEYELIVQPKMAALEREASRLAAAKESNVENRQLQRSLRTRTRRNHTTRTGALQEKNSLDSEDSDVGNVPVQEESVLVDLKNCGMPQRMVAIELLSSPEAKDSPKPPLSAQSNSPWIETKRNVPKVLSNVAMPLNKIKKLEKLPAPADGSKLLNVCYKGLKLGPATPKTPGEPVLSKAPKRKHSYGNASDEAGTSKRNGKRESPDHKKSARKNNRRTGEREISEDEAKAMQKAAKRQQQITYSNGDGRPRSKPKGWVPESSEEEDEEEREEEEGENSSKKNKKGSPFKWNNSTSKKRGMRRLFNPQEKPKNSKTPRQDSSRSSKAGIKYLDSSDYSVDFSSDEQVPKKKRSRKKKVLSSDSSDLSISDDDKKEDDRRKQRNNDFSKPGPSGIAKVRKDFYSDDDDESTDDNLNGKTPRYDRPEKPGDSKKSLAIKTEPYSTAGKSRGQVWRAQLTDRPGENNIHFRHGPFTAGERTIMVNYLVRTRTVNKAKGLIVWKSMIDDGFLKHRTPQSLQNHFKKVILPHIEDCSSLKPEDKAQFLSLRTDKNERFGK